MGNIILCKFLFHKCLYFKLYLYSQFLYNRTLIKRINYLSTRLEIIKTKSLNLCYERNALVNNCISSLIQNQQVINEMINTTNGYKNSDDKVKEYDSCKQNLNDSILHCDYIDKKIINNNNNIGKELLNDENGLSTINNNYSIPIISIDKFNALPINIRGKLKYIQVKNIYDKLVLVSKRKGITSSDIESMNIGVKNLTNEFLIPTFKALGICK